MRKRIRKQGSALVASLCGIDLVSLAAVNPAAGQGILYG